jgi:hypothetical protein
MTTQPHFKAVMECPWYDEESPLFADRPPLWEIETTLEPFSFLPLSSQTTDREVGLIISQLIKDNNLESNGNLVERLTEIINYKSVEDEDYMILAGGLQVNDGSNRIITPSCCCGLETWRDWIEFLSTGESPWLGHDPNPWVEKVNDNLIRVWADEGGGFFIDFDRSTFELKLSEVQQDLADFLVRIETWARKLGFDKPEELSAKFDRCFSISRKWDS